MGVYGLMLRGCPLIIWGVVRIFTVGFFTVFFFQEDLINLFSTVNILGGKKINGKSLPEPPPHDH